MQKRSLGATGMEVSEIAFGGVEIGFPYGIGMETHDQLPSEEEAVALLRAALDQGINLFDTARLYGRSEHLMGRAFQNQRDRVIICTKCTHLQPEDEPLPTKAQIHNIAEKSMRESLVALGTDYVDVYMVHDASPEIIEHQDVIETFCQYKKRGLTRAIGVSIYSVADAQRAIAGGIWDVIQLPFNLMEQRQGVVFPLAQRCGVGIMVRSALFRGILTERGRHLHPQLKAVQEHRRRFDTLLSEAAPTLSQLATRFVLSHPEVSSVLVGMERSEYLEKAIAVADGKYLDEKSLARAKELAFPDPDFLDLPKWDRAGWLK